MSCLNLKGYTRGCDESVGGIKTVVLFETADVSTYTIDSSGNLTTLTLTSTGNAYKYDFLRDNANFTDAVIGAGTVSSVSFQPSVNLTFKRANTDLINEIIQLGKNYTSAVIETNNGDHFTLGIERGLALLASPGITSGNNFEEANGAVLLLQGSERRPIIPTDITAEGIDSKIKSLF